MRRLCQEILRFTSRAEAFGRFRRVNSVLSEAMHWHDRTRVLIVDDDEKGLRALRRGLESIGFEVDAAGTGADALERASKFHHDAFVVDMQMAPHDGLWTCRELLILDPDSIVIFRSGLETDEAKLAAFAAGASDYVPKTGTDAELGARVRAHLRRRGARMLHFGSLIADRSSGAVFVDGVLADLSEQQSRLFWLLIASPGKFQTTKELHVARGGHGELASTRRELQRLRRKLGKCGTMIRMVRCRGYCFDPSPIRRK